MTGQTSMTRQSSGSFMETIRTIIYAVLIAIVVRTFLYEPFNIPSGSMKPTLLVGDYLFVNKWVYGYSRHSLLFSWPPFEGRIWSAPVERGDIVVFKVPTDNKTDYIKRIIGLPGDRIQMKEGRLYINGEQVKREDDGEWTDEDGNTLKRYTETLPGGRQHVIVERNDNDSYDNTEEFVVPAGHYFGMGDNRDNSSDSRAWRDANGSPMHYIPEENVVGRASFIFYSTRANTLWKVWESIPNTRWDRLMSGIH